MKDPFPPTKADKQYEPTGVSIKLKEYFLENGMKQCDIAKVLRSLRGARMGLMGHVMEAMYDMHADPTAISAAFNLHVPLIEIDDAVREYEKVTTEEIEAKKKLILKRRLI